MRQIKRVIAFVLAACVLTLSTGTIQVKAENETFTLDMAKKIGLSNSSSYKLLKNELELANVQYEQSIKALRLKERNQTTFRWSPLLNFTFPEDPNLAEAFEYEYKPIEMQSNIDMLEHEIEDHVYEVYNEIATLFVSIYMLQEKIAFSEARLENYTETLEKNRVRLLLGLAGINDIKTMEMKVLSVENGLISDKTEFEAQKKKMSDYIGFDVRSGYNFDCPFVEAEIERSMLEELIEDTLASDHSYYQAKVAEANARLALDTNYRLMEEQYGAKMSMLDSYINAVKAGEKVDSAAFKLKYREFLEAVDEPWTGTKKIWFIRIPKEWFKGDIDGVRYVEDEPYILYECALEYQNAIKESESIKTEISNLVTDTYENYISATKAVKSTQDSISGKEEELESAEKLNLLGKMTYDEYNSVLEEYEELQLELIQAKGDYSSILYEFNRLTCGKIEELMQQGNVSVTTGGAGQSYVVEDEGTGVYYYIHQMVSENVFEFGLTVSEDAEVEISHFELWVNDTQLGVRTEVGSAIRHLSLDLQQTDEVFVRIYNGNTFVDDCEIDPSIYSGKLTLNIGYTIVSEEDDLLGTYQIYTDEVGMLQITIIPEADKTYSYYNIMTDTGEYLINDNKISVKQSFRYLGLAQSSLENLVINFYDEDEQQIYRGKFDTADNTIRKITEE